MWFDPWKSPLCTCPKKYSFNPYTGCDHACIYCYITSYIPNAFKVREKKDLLRRLYRELKRLDFSYPISMSNSSDPYPTIERTKKLTRAALEILHKFPVKLLITTKSDIVVRDVDILKNMKVAVMITITTLDANLARKLEPNAPSPLDRLKAIRVLSSERIPVGIRLDPIIPYVNDSYESFETIINKAKEAGAKHIVSSTFKPRPDSWKRLVSVFPELAPRIKSLYTTRLGMTWYLKKEVRLKYMQQVKKLADYYSMSFATCREGFIFLHTAKSCDGTHLIELKNRFAIW
ncbi:MAG: SPL family radical SAM protein [Candidatus Asgardarchaeia archaeon]